MKVMKWSAIALAVSAGSTQFAVADAFVSDQAEAKGFIEDSSLDLLLRNYYFNRDGKSGSGDRVDWTQGFLTTYESGFTQGTVGFGVDAFGYLGLKLDGTSDKSGTGNLPVMNDGTPRDDYSRAGGAVKVRISKTMLKWGEMQPTAPVFAAGGSRLFPQTATGFQLQSSELEGLDLEAGHFTEGKEPTTVKSRGELYATYAGETAKSADFIGGRYAITDNLSASLYGAELEDIYRQYYLNSNYTIPLASDQSLGFDFNIYRTNADDLAPPQLEDARLGQQVLGPGLAEEVDVQVRGHGHLDRPETPENDRVHRRVGQRHDGRAGQRSTGTHQLAVKRYARQRMSFVETLDTKIDVLGHGQPHADQRLYLRRVHCLLTPHHRWPAPCTQPDRHRTMPSHSSRYNRHNGQRCVPVSICFPRSKKPPPTRW